MERTRTGSASGVFFEVEVDSQCNPRNKVRLPQGAPVTNSKSSNRGIAIYNRRIYASEAYIEEQIRENVGTSKCVRAKHHGIARNKWSAIVKIHDFYRKFLFNVQALETMGELKEVNGYVRMLVDELEGIRGDLVTTDEEWQEWDFPKFVDALRKWTERNPIRNKPKEKDNESPPSHRRKRSEVPKNTSSYRTQQQHQGEIQSQKCVYCDSEKHKSVECNKVIDAAERRRLLQQKRLCFNCAKE